MTHTQFVVDEKGNKNFVLLPIKAYRLLLEKIEAAEDVRLYDEVKALEKNEERISLKDYRAMRNKKKKHA